MQESDSGTDKTIYIFDCGPGKQGVEPASAVTPKGSTVAWMNVTNSRLILMFPVPSIFEDETRLPIELGPGETSEPMSISENPPRTGPFPYASACIDKKFRVEFSEGGSHPRMIVIG